MAHPSFISPTIQWLWKTNSEPFSSTELEEQWRCYSDVETAIIEEAFQMEREEVLLDHYHINFKHMLQISNNNINKQRSIKRIAHDSSAVRSNDERFTFKPAVSSVSFFDPEKDNIQCFFRQVLSYFDHPPISFPLRDPIFRSKMVEKAAEGLIDEGKKAGQQKVAEWMSEQLLKEKTKREHEIWFCCARLYCMQSFLYEKLNEVMRLVGDSEHKNFVNSKVPTFGPFALLFWKLGEPNFYGNRTVYRGVKLSDDLIQQFQRECVDSANETSRKTFMFTAYTSTSLRRDIAKRYGNVLFTIDISSLDGWNMASYSRYDYEEEILLRPFFQFFITSCEFDQREDKWNIHLISNTVR